MKFVTIIVAITLLAVSSIASAQGGPRKEAVLDTGQDGFRLVVSAPNFAKGPYNLGKIYGPKKKFDGFGYGEVMYNTPLSETGVVINVVHTLSRLNGNTSGQRITPNLLAEEALIGNGFNMERVTMIESPQFPIGGVSVVTYKASGFSVFGDTVDMTRKSVMIVTAVVLQNQTQGFAIGTLVAEKNVPNFDADPAKYEKLARDAYEDLLKFLTVSQN